MVFVLRNSILSEVNPNDVLPSDIPVYSIADCCSRVQNPAETSRGGDPAHPERSIMAPGQYRNTQAAVNRTLGDFNNNQGNNIPLWLRGDMALYYAGIDQRHMDVFPMTPQPGLNSPNSMVSLIPPRHMERDGLTAVYPSPSTSRSMAAGGTTLNAFGLAGVVRSVFGFRAEVATTALRGGHDGFVAFAHHAGDGFDEGNRNIAFIVDVRGRALERLVGQRLDFPWLSDADCVGVERAPQ